jgi:lysophospholipase L1-like esterase
MLSACFRQQVAGTVLLAAQAVFSLAARSDGGELPVRNGDMVVVVGDSITVSGLYERLIECYFRTRFPRWKIGFRNAGVNGYRADLGREVVDEDVLAWKPSVVIINYGMNDGRAPDGFQRYARHIGPYVEKARSGGARIILSSNSPIDIGDPPGKFSDFNVHFHQMAQFARRYAAEHDIFFVDQFHPLHELWGRNRQRSVWIVVTWQSGTPGRPNDYVHPAPPGHLTMAYTILKGMGVPGEVSYAAIDLPTGRTETRRAAISGLKISPGEVSFVRADEASPCGVEEGALAGNQLVPFLDTVNSMPLRITGLRAGPHDLLVDGVRVARFDASEFARGVNLGAFPTSPVYGPGNRTLAAIGQQRRLVNAAREVLKFKPPPWARIDDLKRKKQAEWESLNKKVLAADDATGLAAQPSPLAIRIVPAK